LVRLGRGQEAVSMLENALPTWRRASGDNPDHTQAAFLHFLAFGYVAVGRYVDAERTATEYLARVNGKLAPNARMIGFGHLVLGQALAGQRRYQEALPHAKIAVDLLVKSAVSPYNHELGSQATQLVQQVNMALQTPVGPT
jgi:tetratricopeptide (TPR) repeat protein